MINFGVWAPSQEVFWQTWIDAGICSAPGEYVPPYLGGVDTTAGAWDGIVYKNGNAVPGWHCNVMVFGALSDLMSQGLSPCDVAGNPKSVWDRTHAKDFFQLTLEPANPETGFPAGYRSPSGVTYADAASFTSPANAWA